MKIVFDNRSNRPIHECNVCNKQGHWSNRWRACEYGIGVGVAGYEAIFITCSEQCRQKDNDEKIMLTIRKLQQHGWWEAHEDALDEVDKSLKEIIFKNMRDGK